MAQENKQIDEQRDSRFLAIMGHKFHAKLMQMRVLIHGLSGVGLEVAKNLILTGSKSVAVFDNKKVQMRDLGSNFYASQQSVGKQTRGQASIQQLKQLNPSVKVSLIQNDDITFISENYDCVVVFDNYDRKYLLSLNESLRKNNKAFILAGNLGLYGYTFVDFGQKHQIIDCTGQQPLTVEIAGITQDQHGLVFMEEKAKHGLNNGDHVIFKDVRGMKQINGEIFQVKVKDSGSFTIGDTRAFSGYETGGMAVEVKKPMIMSFKSLENSLRCPYGIGQKELPICSWQKWGTPEQLHVCLNAVYDFYQKHQRVPKDLSQEQASELVELAKQWLKKKMDVEGQQFKVQNIDQNLVRNVARFAECQISPVCSFWGGIIAQEIIKLTGKFTPLKQWLHHQFFETLPKQQVIRTIAETRYQDYQTLFGNEFIKVARNTRSFLVGAGALGCQFVKLISLMGLGVQNKGRTICTDDDNIEVSNLSRQFLFRNHHVGKNKCETACNAGNEINSQVRFDSLKLKVCDQNAEIFDDQFWNDLDIVINAVDNVKARQYIDDQCVWFEKPLFESGTLGTKCHTQIILPKHTISYRDIRDPPEKGFALCTLKNAPYMIQHTIQWARDYFEGCIAQPSNNLSKLYQNPQKLLDQIWNQFKHNSSTLKQKLEIIQKYYILNESKSYEKCVETSINIFEAIFHHQIRLLVELFPENCISNDTGRPFWSGTKRFPQIIQIDLKDPLHLDFIQAGANILATMINIPMEHDKAIVIQIASEIKPIEYKPKNNVKIELDQNKAKEDPQKNVFNEQDKAEAEELINRLRAVVFDKNKSPKAVDFEKDDPKNFHIEFMGGISNLRARNYKIEQVDNFKIKIISGKIIPATATSTATIVGAVGIQIIKYLLKKEANCFKNVTINLALPLFIFNDGTEAIMYEDKEFDTLMNGPIKVLPGKFTKWDKIDVEGPMLLGQLIANIQKEINFKISMVTYGNSTIYASFNPASKRNLQKKVDQAIQQVTKTEIPKWKIYIPISFIGEDEKGVDIIIPIIRYKRK